MSATNKVASVDNPSRSPKGIQSVVTAFKVLECLGNAPGPISLKHLADELHMPPSKLRFYLISLLELGFVTQELASARYVLGPGALRLGLSALEKIDIVRAVRDEMPTLADTIGFTVFLSVWGSHGPTIIDRVDGRNRTVLEIRVGSVLPLITSATGRIFCAFMPSPVTATMLRRERKALVETDHASAATDPDFDLDSIRRYRFARSNDHLLVGFGALGSPILDRAGLPVAVLTVVGPSRFMSNEIESPPAKRLLEVTTRLSHYIGWTDPVSV